MVGLVQLYCHGLATAECDRSVQLCRVAVGARPWGLRRRSTPPDAPDERWGRVAADATRARGASRARARPRFGRRRSLQKVFF